MRISDWSSDVCSSDLEDLKFAGFVPTTNVKLAEVDSASPVDVFKAANRQDVLLHHPYDSFATSVQRFIEQAAADKHVLAIKQTLYRTSEDPPIIDALVDAAAAGRSEGRRGGKEGVSTRRSLGWPYL